MTWGHLGRRRAYLPSRFEFRDAEGRVGCGIAGSTSLSGRRTKKKKLPPPGIEPGSIAWEAISLPLAQEGACMGIESEPLREFLQVPPALVSIDES